MKRGELERTGGWGERVLPPPASNTSERTNRTLPNGRVVLALLVALAMPIIARADQYTAFSLRVAQQRIEQAGENWRQKEPEVANLGGINKVEGFVYDSNTSDLILVGEHEQGRAALTLDDLVVALRARFRYNEWPLVSIDPTPDTEKTQMQHVRFEGGIQDTAFGRAMFDADYRLKEMCMGLQPPGVEGLRTYWDRGVAEINRGTVVSERSVNSRFWFYPINPYVTVREGVCVVRGLKVSVFTEVMAAKIDGKPNDDLKGFKDQIGDAFAGDVSEKFESLCAAQPSFNLLRGLEELVAVSKALEELEKRPELSFWLEKYPLAKSETPKETKVLRRRYDGKRGLFEVSGGVHLTALAMRLNAGDVTALREAVLKVRPSSNDLGWTFLVADWVIPIGTGQVKPEDVAPLFSQALFLQDRGRHTDALALYDEILKLDPDFAGAWSNKGVVLVELGRTDEAIKCYGRALEINPSLSKAWCNKGVALHKLGRTDEALKCFDRALEINPRDAEVWCNKGGVLHELGRTDEAIKCSDRALEINPSLFEAWYNKGLVLVKLGRTDEAIKCFDRALEINPRYAEAWYNKGVMLGNLGRTDEELQCYDRALEINPSLSVAWYNKGLALHKLGRTDEAIKCFDRALEINPRYVKVWCNKGGVLHELGRTDEAIKCFDRALEINPSLSEAWYNKGVTLYKLNRYGEARKCFEEGVKLGHAGSQRGLDVLRREGH